MARGVRQQREEASAPIIPVVTQTLPDLAFVVFLSFMNCYLYGKGVPIPAALNALSLGPLPAQQSAS